MHRVLYSTKDRQIVRQMKTTPRDTSENMDIEKEDDCPEKKNTENKLSSRLSDRLSCKDKTNASSGDIASRLDNGQQSQSPAIGPVVMPKDRDTFGFSSEVLKTLDIALPITKDVHITNVSAV